MGDDARTVGAGDDETDMQKHISRWGCRGVWYSANNFPLFILLKDYLNVTGDRALADYGGAENLLECVPTYINEVVASTH